MSYGFSCGYCRETIETPFSGHENAETFADMAGWRLTYGHTDAWGGNAHNTCPICASGTTDRMHLCSHPKVPVTGLLMDVLEQDH